MELTEKIPLSHLLRIRPAAVGLLNASGLKFWHQLDLPLEEFCRISGLDTASWIRQVQDLPVPPEDSDWAKEPLYLIMDHLTAQHREFRTKHLSNILHLLEREGLPIYPDAFWLQHVHRAFLSFKKVFLAHMREEENRVILKPVLIEAGKTYEHEGALWLRSTEYGDDKDRVMRKSDGSYTYFVPDVAYHITKFERGFERVVNIQGTDHHGTIARVRAGLQAVGLGIPQGYPDYVLHTMVRVMRGGAEVKISKRAGSYVTLRDLIEMTNKDAVRFFLLSRKPDTEYVFDVDLAVQKNNDNPVFYVQYAHARICSVLAKEALAGDWTGLDLSPLESEAAQSLMLELARYPEVLRMAANDFAPHDITFYLRDLAAAYHSYYDAERILADEPGVRQARLALVAATAQVLRNGLRILGVSAPEKM